MNTPSDPLCAVVEASCICDLAPDHEGAHHCECGGEWRYDENGEFHAVAFPGNVGIFQAIGLLLGGFE